MILFDLGIYLAWITMIAFDTTILRSHDFYATSNLRIFEGATQLKIVETHHNFYYYYYFTISSGNWLVMLLGMQIIELLGCLYTVILKFYHHFEIMSNIWTGYYEYMVWFVVKLTSMGLGKGFEVIGVQKSVLRP